MHSMLPIDLIDVITAKMNLKNKFTVQKTHLN
jgi:hypothetical protein